jgi:hypothetical protein
VEEERMPAGNQESHEGRLRIGVLEGRGEEVPLHVMNGNEGLVQGVGHRLGPGDAHQQCPDEAGPAGDRHGVQVLQLPARLPQSLVHDLLQLPEMGPGRQLRDHASIDRMDILRQNDVPQNRPLPIQERRRGFITAGLDTENQGLTHSPVGLLRRTHSGSRLA